MKQENTIIIGASSGLGFELFKHYNSKGHKIFLITKNIIKLKKNLKNYSMSKNFEFSYLDLDKISNISKVMLKAKSYLKNNIDNVIHVNGGGLGIKEIDPDYKRLIKVLNINLLGSIEINKKIIPLMKRKRSGRIIHISSIAGFESVGSISYNMAKSSLNAYVRTMGKHLANFNIILTGIAPGGFIANDNAMHRLKNKNYKAYKNFINRRIPRKKMGKTSEIIPLIDFLSSSHAGMMCGCIVPIDGGEGNFYNLL